MATASRRLSIWICSTLIAGTLSAAVGLPAGSAYAAAPAKTEAKNVVSHVYAERKSMFEQVGTLTSIPWTVLAAIDQYERTIQLTKKRKTSDPNRLIAIDFSEGDWAGKLNPDQADTNRTSIAFFGGLGQDGDGDGQASRSSDLDRLYAMAALLLKRGSAEEDLRTGLWEHYRSSRSVERISQFARMYQTFDTLELHEHRFVMPLGADYSYRSTWGASRGWGGARIHEGTDIFARHGVPVRSATYGIVEVMGWNMYGGWRIGIRDLNNVYHYYAHLSGFNKKDVQQGSIVTPGQVVGWVGSSGYGKPGTSGKFPPHLHYGMYRDNGSMDWSFDPYPHLRKWEREERLRRQKK
nr:M23 family metallopeptidase [Paenibacillus sp. YYML68]